MFKDTDVHKRESLPLNRHPSFIIYGLISPDIEEARLVRQPLEK